MDISGLKAFVAVAERGSFSAAAEALFLTQPAVSKRISMLEQELGNRLFDRIGRTARLTQAGQTLLLRANRILQELAVAEREVRDLSDTVGGTLNIATSHHIGLHRLPPVLRQFTDSYPDVRLNIDFTDSEKAHDAVLQGNIELAVITLALDESPAIDAVTLWNDPLCFVAGHEHPLASQEAVTLKELAACENVLPGMDTYTGQIVQRLFEKKRLRLDTLMATNYLETIKMMVNVGIGWSVLPKTMLDDSLLALPVEGTQLSRQLGYIVHRNHSRSNAASAFIKLLASL